MMQWRAVLFVMMTGAVLAGTALAVDYEIQVDTVLKHDDGAFLWFHPRVTPIPRLDDAQRPGVLMVLQKHLQVSDFYSGAYTMWTDDSGATWTGPEERPELAWQRDEERGVSVAVCDITPGWHAPTGKALAIGAQIRYSPQGGHLDDVPRAHQTAYAVFDPAARAWTPWRAIEMPPDEIFEFSRNACAQWLTRADGALLLPLYIGRSANEDFSVTVAEFDFDGDSIRYRRHGNIMAMAGGRGLCEPSVTCFQGRYYLTLRNDNGAYVTVSDDGLQYAPIQPWRFDDGAELGSYNTQQHWLAHSDGLFLVYTRRGADNDHIMRHRAPLFIAQVDPERLCVIRATERVLIPERGATMGNFGAVAINEHESWVTVGEGVWNDDMRKRGAEGRLLLARVIWKTPNLLARYPFAVEEAPFRVMDLDVGESARLQRPGGEATVKLVKLDETRDPIREAVRSAKVTVEVNGERAVLESGLYNLPARVGGLRVDCPVTAGYNRDSTPESWGIDKAARIRVWPAEGPLLSDTELGYPLRQRWLASLTWFDNQPVDGGASIGKPIYYHSGVDLGGVDGVEEVLAATDALVVSSGMAALPGHDREPVNKRHDVVYLLDKRGWYYRYSHMDSIDARIVPGLLLRKGERIGILGKEGESGGWAHLHFEIKSMQPSGKWGTQAAYALLHEAYVRQYQPAVLACARPQQLVRAGDTALIDGTKSWAASGAIASYHWTFHDGETAEGAVVEKRYPSPGRFTEILKVSDALGNVDYDTVVMQVIDPEAQDQYMPSLHAAYAPSIGIRPGAPITFSARVFRCAEGAEVWDFGDGSPLRRTKSNINPDRHAKDGYAMLEHRYAAPGVYHVRITRDCGDGVSAVTHLHVVVGE